MQLKNIQVANGVQVTGPTIGGSGTGEINVIASSNDASSGWTASAAGVTVATTTTAGDLPLGSVITTAIKITPVSGTDYVYYRWTMPESLKNRKLKVEWWQRYESGYATGDLKLEVYKNSASNYGGSYTEFDLSTDSSGTSSIPAANGKFTSTFDADSGDYYELRIVRTAGSNYLSIASVVVGPGTQPQASVVGKKTSFVPGISSWGTGSSASGFWTREGEHVLLDLSDEFDGSIASTFSWAAANFMPSGLTINENLMQSGAGGNDHIPVGSYSITDNGVGDYCGIVNYDLSSNTIICATPAGGANVNSTTPATWTSSDGISVRIKLPVSEWAGSGTINVVQNDVEYASTSGTWDAASSTTVYGPGGTAMGGALTASRTKTVTFVTPIQTSDSISVEASSDGVVWVPVNDSYAGTGTAAVVKSRDSTGAFISGVSWAKSSATAVDVTFARYAAVANDDAPTTDWGTYYWRVVKRKAGAAVGFGQATTSSLGLVKAGQVPGQVTGSGTAAGYIGEIITGSSSSPAIGTAGTATEVYSIALTAGVWQIFGKVGYIIASTSVMNTDNYIAADISSISGTLQLTTYNEMTVPGSSSKGRSVLVNRTVALSASATYYLNGRHNLSTTTGSSYDTAGADSSSLYAVRIG